MKKWIDENSSATSLQLKELLKTDQMLKKALNEVNKNSIVYSLPNEGKAKVTPLLYAVMEKKTGWVDFLLEMGAESNIEEEIEADCPLSFDKIEERNMVRWPSETLSPKQDTCFDWEYIDIVLNNKQPKHPTNPSREIERVDVISPVRYSPVLMAARLGYLDMIKKMDVQAWDAVLLVSILFNQLEVFQYVLAQNKDNITDLLEQAKRKDYSIYEVAFCKGGSFFETLKPYFMKIQDEKGSEMLKDALKHQHTEFVDTLITAGIGLSGGLDFVIENRNFEMLNWILGQEKLSLDLERTEEIVNRYCQNEKGQNISAEEGLSTALENNWYHIAKILLEMRDVKFEPEEKYDAEHKFLTRAVNQKNNDFLTLMLEHGANPNHFPDDERGLSPLYGAVFHKSLDMVKTLLSHGADINFEGQTTGINLLSEAIIKRDREIFDYLMNYQDQRIRVLVGSGSAFLPLYVACSYLKSSDDKTHMIKTMFERISPNALLCYKENSNDLKAVNKTLLEIAVEFNCIDIIEWLVNVKGVDINANNPEDGYTVLGGFLRDKLLYQSCFRVGQKNIVSKLTSLGATVSNHLKKTKYNEIKGMLKSIFPEAKIWFRKRIEAIDAFLYLEDVNNEHVVARLRGQYIYCQSNELRVGIFKKETYSCVQIFNVDIDAVKERINAYNPIQR